jgi:hypothetical protein
MTTKNESPRAIDRVRSDILNTVGYVPRLVVDALDDIRTIAEMMRYLPDLKKLLASIDAKVELLDAEVTRMREGVDAIDGRVVQLNDSVEHRLDELSRVLRPLKRTTARFGRMAGRRTGEAANAPLDEE